MSKLVLVLMVCAALLLVGCGRSEEKATTEQPAQTAQQGPVTQVDPATAATITGKVNYEGPKPSPRLIRMDAEPVCKGKHTTTPVSEEVILNDNGTLANAFVYVKTGLEGKNFETPKTPAVLDQDGCVYKPHVFGVQAGQEIQIRNSDPTTHNIHPLPANNREWNESQPPNAQPLVKSFPREELLIPVKCNVHPWMKSYIGVTKHPYFAVTGQDGAFEIKNLPPGSYTLAVWHEKFGTQEQQVTVGEKESKAVEFTVKGDGAASPAAD